MQAVILVVAVLAALLGLAPSSSALDQNTDRTSTLEQKTVIKLLPGTLPYPTGHNLTDEFIDQGVLFSNVDSDLPPEYQMSLGDQENLISSASFFNLFRLNLLVPGVNKVEVHFTDFNSHHQTHTLTAFDDAGNVLDSDSFADTGSASMFILIVRSTTSIAKVVAIEQPFGAERCELIKYTTAFRVVPMDIRPGSDRNLIHPRSSGHVPVAILTTPDFDASQVDLRMVAFGPNGARVVDRTGQIRDVDGDCDLDLVLRFKVRETGIKCGDTEAVLTGATLDRALIEAADAIRTVGCW